MDLMLLCGKHKRVGYSVMLQKLQTPLRAPVHLVCYETCLVWVNKLLRLCKGLWQGQGAPRQGALRAPQLHAQPQSLEWHLSNDPASGFRQNLHRQAGLMLS